jgi:RNA polymerase sigma factor (sigma-70 family)
MSLFKHFSDKTIIDGVRLQDEKILSWLYDNYLQAVKKYVLSNNGNSDDVADVFQDSIIILYRQITEENLNLTTELKGYFFGIARNVWNAQLRKKQRTTELDIDIVEEDGVEDFNNQLLERVVSRAFLKLEKDQQKVLKMYSEGKSYEIIAKKLDLKNETNARRKKYMCKEALLEIMKQDPEYQEYLRLQK